MLKGPLYFLALAGLLLFALPSLSDPLPPPIFSVQAPVALNTSGTVI